MKKLLLIGLYLCLATSVFAQNTFPSIGNVGIGTTNPSSMLEVMNSNNTRVLLNKNNQSAISFLPNNTNSWFHISHGLNDDLHISHGINPGDSKIITIKNYGNVGIGTTNPNEKLQVSGGNIQVGQADGLGGEIYLGNPNHGLKRDLNMVSLYSAGSNGGISFLHKNWDGQGYNTWVTQMQISSSGNVGIGTTNPGTWKLAVNGNIRAKEVKVETGWSDFVFEPGYVLPTLEEVERHIQEKGHLPEIPSAAEVAQNGIFLGEMDAKLLQKIEELTLYTIEQEKELQKQKVINEELRARLLRLEKLWLDSSKGQPQD